MRYECLADAMAQIPSRPVRADAERAHHLIGRNPFLGFAHEIDGGKPLAMWQVGIVHDGPRRHAELVAS